MAEAKLVRLLRFKAPFISRAASSDTVRRRNEARGSTEFLRAQAAHAGKMVVQLLLHDDLLSVVKVVHSNAFDILHNEIHRAVIFKAADHLWNWDVCVRGDILHCCGFVQNSFSSLPGNMNSPFDGADLPLGRAQTSFDECLPGSIVFSFRGDREAFFPSLIVQHLVGDGHDDDAGYGEIC